MAIENLVAKHNRLAVCIYDTTTNPVTGLVLNVDTGKLTQSANVATAVIPGHGLTSGDTINVAGASLAAYNVSAAVITVVDRNTFTFPVAGNPVSPAVAARADQPITITMANANYSAVASAMPLIEVEAPPSGTTVVIEGRLHNQALWSILKTLVGGTDLTTIFQPDFASINQLRVRRSVGTGNVKAWAQQ